MVILMIFLSKHHILGSIVICCWCCMHQGHKTYELLVDPARSSNIHDLSSTLNQDGNTGCLFVGPGLLLCFGTNTLLWHPFFRPNSHSISVTKSFYKLLSRPKPLLPVNFMLSRSFGCLLATLMLLILRSTWISLPPRVLSMNLMFLIAQI